MPIKKKEQIPNVKCDNCGKEVFKFGSKINTNKRNFCSLQCNYNVRWSWYPVLKENAGNRTKQQVADLIGVPIGTIDTWCRHMQKELPEEYRFSYANYKYKENRAKPGKGLPAVYTPKPKIPVKIQPKGGDVATTTNRNTFGADKAIREPRDRSKETAVVFVNGKQIWFDPALKKAEDITKKYQDRDRQKYIDTYGRNPPDYEGGRQAYIH